MMIREKNNEILSADKFTKNAKPKVVKCHALFVPLEDI